MEPLWLLTWTQRLWRCLRCSAAPDQITLTQSTEFDKEPAGLQFELAACQSGDLLQGWFWEAAVHKVVCHPDVVIFLCLLVRCSRKNRYFSCGDKEKLYCRVIPAMHNTRGQDMTHYTHTVQRYHHITSLNTMKWKFTSIWYHLEECLRFHIGDKILYRDRHKSVTI